MKKKVFRFEYDIDSRELTDVTDMEEEKEFPEWANISPDSSYAVYAKGYNLYGHGESPQTDGGRERLHRD